jgi:ABC-type multidrug transport system fused ATPase/permease subunit
MIAVIYSHVSNVSEMAIGAALRVLGDSIVFVALLAVLLVTDVTAVLVLGPVLVSVIFIFRALMTERVREAGHQSGLALMRLLASIQNALNGIKEIRILGVEENFVDTARKNVKQYADAFIAYSCISVIPRFFIEFLVISSVAVLAIYYTLRGDSGEHVMATLGVFAIVGLRVMPSVQNILFSLNNMAFSKPSVDYLYTDLKELDGRGRAASGRRIAATDKPEPAFEKLVLKDVTYRYPASDRAALDKINLTIRQGQSIGVVGPSGSGKSTLIDVIIGLLQPGSGEILCNGRNISDPASGWSQLVAYIPQMLFLVDDTVRRNVALGVPDAEIDEDRLHLALRQARIDDMVAALPNGLDTMLGDRGLRVSGGQRQRVALARTFYFGRQVLVLDEATSALDQEVEKEIVEEIHRLKGTKTLIVIAHRLSTVRECDLLIRIEEGRITAVGNFEQVVGAADIETYRIAAAP